MAVQLRESLRRKRPVFTNDQRAELVDTMLLERYTPPEPTLTEMHDQWIEANQERDRLQSLGREAEEKLAGIQARMRDNIKSRPTFRKQFEFNAEQASQQWHDRLGEVQQALAELNASVDWDVLQAGEKRFQKAVADMMKAHNAARVETAREAAVSARKRYDDARAALTLDKPYPQLVKDYGKAAELEVAALLAERAAAEVEKAVKGR